MAGAKTYKSRHSMPTAYDRTRLQKAAECVYPALARELVMSIAENASYDKISENGSVGINRGDFYGYRRKVIDAYVERGG